MYEKCELKWPSYITILIFIFIVTGSAAALYRGPDLTNHFNNFGCKLTAILDDTLNGRISPSDDTKFFVGISPLKDELTTFNGSFNTFFSESNTSLNASHDIRNRQTAIENML